MIVRGCKRGRSAQMQYRSEVAGLSSAGAHLIEIAPDMVVIALSIDQTTEELDVKEVDTEDHEINDK